MMYRRYYSYNDMPIPIKSNPSEKKINNVPKKQDKKEPLKLGILSQLDTDDIVLLAIIFLLLMDDCNDIFLLLALGFIFISKE